MILNWNKVNIQYINDVNKWNEKKEEIVNKYIEKRIPNAHRSLKFVNCYMIITGESFQEIRVFGENCAERFQISFTGCKNETSHAGHDGYNFINSYFKEKYGEDETLFKAFSGVKYKEQYQAIKKCVITQVDYICKKYERKIVSGCFKSDVSSAYPYQLTKTLPTLHDCKVLKGRIEPTEEYPFAFYTKSHHVKIYNELYTKDLRYSHFYSAYESLTYKWKPIDYILAEKDETILCKASTYSLKDIFEDIYKQRKSNPNIKLFMNACIGYFHKNGDPFLSHIAAVVLARCAVEMTARAEKLSKEGNIVLLINTDSIIWKGQQSTISIPLENKTLGSFAVEYENIRVCLKGIKAYQLETNDGKCITKYSGATREENNSLRFGELLQRDDITGLEEIIVYKNGMIEVIK